MKMNVQNIVQMKLNPILHDRRGPYEIGGKQEHTYKEVCFWYRGVLNFCTEQ